MPFPIFKLLKNFAKTILEKLVILFAVKQEDHMYYCISISVAEPCHFGVALAFWHFGIFGVIRIRGSKPLTNGSGFCYFFIIDLQDANRKTNLKKVVLLITF